MAKPLKYEANQHTSGLAASCWERVIWHAGTNSCCCVVAGLVTVGLLLTIGVVTLPLTVETNFEAFMMTDVESSIKLHALERARADRSGFSRRLQAEKTFYMVRDLHLYYELTDEGLGLSGGIYHDKVITEISKFEKRLLNLPEWVALCNLSPNASKGLCDPGMSFVRYKLPTLRTEPRGIVPASLVLDGHGFEPVSIRTAVWLVEQQGMADLMLPEDYKNALLDDEPTGSILRSAFRFHLPFGGSADSSVAKRQQERERLTGDWESFFIEALLPEFKAGPDRGLVAVRYGGSGLQAIEIKRALHMDFGLAAASLTFIFVYLFVHTCSPLLALLGPLIALSSVPLTFMVCAVFFGTTTLSFANFLAIFLIVGFGADVILVYTDYWEASVKHSEKFPERLEWTYAHAIRSSSTTTGTTALAFLANLASVIRALRQFGFFMGMCVVLAWVVISCIYAPLLVVNARYACSCRQRGPAKGDTRTTKYMRWLHGHRRTVLCISLVVVLVCVGSSVPNLRMGASLPSLFPDNHNEVLSAEVSRNFSSMSGTFGSKFAEPRQEERVCKDCRGREESACKESLFFPPSCSMFWCEANQMLPHASQPWEPGLCKCMRRARTECEPNKPKAIQRFVGPSSVDLKQIQDDILPYIVSTGGGLEHRPFSDSDAPKVEALPPTLLQEWETGNVALQQSIQVNFELKAMATDVASSCGWEDLCFCGGAVCKMPEEAGWTSDFSFYLSEPNSSTRRLQVDSSARRLQVARSWQGTTQVARSLQGTARPGRLKRVMIAFGLEVSTRVAVLGSKDPAESWGFAQDFDLRQPWTQRNIYAFCRQLPAELRAEKRWCWMETFRKYVKGKGKRFPCRQEEFNALADGFVASGTSNTPGSRYLWMFGGEVRALYISIHSRMELGDHAAVLKLKEAWDEHLRKWNAQAVKSARGAFHVSTAWVEVESTSELFASTTQTMVILFVLSWWAMVCFTRSCGLSLFVVVSTMTVVVGLLFFIAVVKGWAIGLLEVISIIYFIGYALDYSLHIAYKYSDPDALVGFAETGKTNSEIRFQRTEYAMRSIGGAVVGSAVTTMGASLFLVFCNLTLFRKLGGMCLAVSLLSVFISMVPLPAALMTFGPLEPGCRCFRSRKATGSRRGGGGKSAGGTTEFDSVVAGA